MSDRMPSLREATRPRLREAMLGVLELGGAPDDAVARKGVARLTPAVIIGRAEGGDCFGVWIDPQHRGDTILHPVDDACPQATDAAGLQWPE